MYKIQLSNKAVKFLRSLPEEYRNAVKHRLEELHETVIPRDSKQLKGHPNCFRLRIGPFRVQYHFLEKERTILIYKISKRGETTYK
jgi:mRNA interferase RelE/StbE